MGEPPEANATALRAGPGVTPLLGSAAGWTALGVVYDEVATRLASELCLVQSGWWQGDGAESYVAAHQPFLAWLQEMSLRCKQAAAGEEAAAMGYAAAVAAMPTVGAIAANRAIRAALSATNFFGINSIPIAMNETDYARMWILAAEVMNVYEVGSAGALGLAASIDPPAPGLLSGADLAVPGFLVELFTVLRYIPEFIFNVIYYITALIFFVPVWFAVFEVSTFLSEIFLSIQVISLTPAEVLPISVPIGTTGGASIVSAAVALPTALSTGLPVGVGIPVRSQTMGVDAENTEEVPREPGMALDAESAVDDPISLVTGNQGAETWGFAGSGFKETIGRPPGFVVLAGGGPQVPMLPATWASHGVSKSC